MLKYKYIIDNLTEKQKIMLLSDINCLSAMEYKALGIPNVVFGDFSEFCKKRFPSPVSMANAFDGNLIAEVGSSVCNAMMLEGINCVSVPSAKLKINPTRYALSEDPYVCGRMAGEYIAATTKMQMASSLPDFAIRDDESMWLDKKPDARMLAEYLVKPHRMATQNNSACGAYTDAAGTISEYIDVNNKLADIAKNQDSINFGGFSIRRNIPAEDTVKYILAGQICVGGSAAIIKTALNRYDKIKRAIPVGRATVDELDREVLAGNAISIETIDEACDRIIEFAHMCNDKKTIIPSVDEEAVKALAYKAACESAVLLENKEKILPITGKRRKIALIGDIIVNYDGTNGDGIKEIFEESTKKVKEKGQKNIDESAKEEKEVNPFDVYIEKIKGYGYKHISFARGYDMGKERDASELSAFGLAEKSDVCVVFVGTNPESEKYITRTERMTLPANQIAMLDRLQSMGKKIVVVMSSNYSLEADFAEKFAGFILAPLNTQEGVMAAIDIVLGKACPSGKLSSSLYSDTQKLLLKQKAYRNTWNVKAGGFIGYRYYDTAGYALGYPFGYGLSYTKFAYSHISVSSNKLTLTVKNTGKMKGSEIVQVYLGMENSPVISPKRELVNYQKVTLKPGEKTTVSFEISPIEIYDEKNGKFVKPKGTYTLYVASSLNDVKYKKHIRLGEDTVEPDNKKLSSYLQSHSNIIDDKYTLEANFKLMKKHIRNIIFGIGSLALAIALFIFTALSEVKATIPTVSSIVLVFASMAFFALEFYDRKVAHNEERKRLDEANAEQFADAEHIEVYAAENMFIEEFDKADAVVSNEEIHYVKNDENDFFVHVNKELTFAEACYDFNTFATEKGFKFSADTIREVFASLASSRIIIMKDTTDEKFRTLVMLLGEYFDCPLALDYVSSRYINEESVLFKNGEDGERIKTNVLKGLENAYHEKHNVQIIALGDIELRNISNYFVSFARYARNPSGAVSIQARNERNYEATYVIPQNTWFILNLKTGDKITNMPEYLADVSSVVKFDYTKCPMAEVRGDVRKFKFYQFEYLLDKCKNVHEFSEDTWKKIDKLEEYTKLHAPFSIGNKLCTGIEKYSSTFIACEGDMTVAIDKAVASKLLPSVIITVSNNRNKDARGLGETLDAIFGEENTTACRNTLSSSGADII